MRISIVTLSFNQRRFLGEALDSVLRQGYRDLEYIVVDPGSTDGSRELIQANSAQLAEIIFEPDRGAADGLNKGFSRARGEILGFLNGDDVLMPGSLGHVADFFQNHPECELAFGDGHLIDGEGRKLRHYRSRDFSVKRYFYGGSSWMQQSTFFRSALFARSPKFNVENQTCWDGELFVKMALQGARIGYLHKDLAGFRIHGQSISGTGRLNKQYRADGRRIFAEVFGRNWTARDDFLRLIYRSEGLLVRLLTGLQEKPQHAEPA